MLLKILKREIINYIKDKFFIKYIIHYKSYKFFKNLDLSTLEYSYTIENRKNIYYNMINTKRYIIVKKYITKFSSYNIKDMFIETNNEKYFLEHLVWLGKQDIIKLFEDKIKSLSYTEIKYESDINPVTIALERKEKISKILN